MEPPYKKPRLSIFEESPSGAELDDARHGNDMTFKSRLEAIFDKYTKDFTGIGDEVDLLTGKVVVNNGHLESMETETDAGVDHLNGDFTAVSRSMLRAMTVNLNPDLPGPDDVLQSIEAIAENATLIDDESTEEGEDDIFEVSRLSTQSRSKFSHESIEQDSPVIQIDPYNSDSDSLFEEGRSREQSVDSLFDNNADHEGDKLQDIQSYVHHPSSIEEVSPTAIQDIDDDGILARFGPRLGKEVLSLLGQRQDAHIDPAWRIPVKLDRTRQRQTSSFSKSPSPVEERLEGKQNRSLWALPKSRRNRPSKQYAMNRRMREESIDPLQEDFIEFSDASQPSNDTLNYTDHEEEGEEQSLSESEQILDSIVNACITGDCPYCHKNFRDKAGVMAHWDRVLKHFAKRVKQDDTHNVEVITRARANVQTRIRDTRLIVYDFRTMIELHEGIGMSWQEIVASKTLRTSKNALRLQEAYNKHRTLPAWTDNRTEAPNWTEADEETLQNLCKNPLTTLRTVHCRLKNHTLLEIGNHLADNWLAQLGVVRGQSKRGNLVSNSELLRRQEDGHSHQDDSMLLRVKQENSEDELFAV